MADDGHLGALAGLPHDFLDLDDALFDLGHFELQQPLQKDRIGPADDHLRRTARLTTHLFDDRPERVALTVTIARDLLLARQDQLRAVVHDQHLAPANLIDFTDDDFANQLGIFLIDFFPFPDRECAG